MATITTMAVVIAVFVVAASDTMAGEPVRFAEIEGTYISSLDGGCLLELQKDGSFLLMCASRPLRRGQAVRFGKGFAIIGGNSETEVQLPPAPPPGGTAADWPPSRRDPTKVPSSFGGMR